MVSQGFDVSSPYFRTKQSYNKKVRFVFENIKENIIGNFGLSGGGAAGLEIDSFNKELGSPENAIILASSKKTPLHLTSIIILGSLYNLDISEQFWPITINIVSDFSILIRFFL